MIQVQHVTKAFPARVAVDDVSFEVEKREILGFLGPNGAGKTTTIRMITGFLPPTQGTVIVDGHDVVESPIEVKRLIGYLPEHVPLYHEMRVHEYLEFRAALKGVAGGKIRQAVERVLEECIIGDVRKRIVGQLSKGYRQRVGLADALVANPPILILDEPTIGLDPKQIRETRRLIKQLGKERIVILSSHILPEVEAVCDRVVIIAKGRLVGEGTPDQLRRKLRGQLSIRADVRGEDFDSAAFKSINGALGVESRQLGDGSFRVVVTAGKDSGPIEEDVFKVCVARGWMLRRLERSEPTLEDIFVEIVASETHADEELDAAEEGGREEPASPVSGGDQGGDDISAGDGAGGKGEKGGAS